MNCLANFLYLLFELLLKTTSHLSFWTLLTCIWFHLSVSVQLYIFWFWIWRTMFDRIWSFLSIWFFADGSNRRNKSGKQIFHKMKETDFDWAKTFWSLISGILQQMERLQKKRESMIVRISIFKCMMYWQSQIILLGIGDIKFWKSRKWGFLFPRNTVELFLIS